MNALFLPQQVSQNVTPPPHSATVWADIQGRLWFQLPNHAPVQINTGNNALVPSNAAIQPPQTFVVAYPVIMAGQAPTSVLASVLGITSIDLTALIGGTYDNLNNILLYGNSLSVASVNLVLTQLAGSSALGNSGGIDISEQTPPAAPTGAGATAKANLISAGWSVTTD